MKPIVASPERGEAPVTKRGQPRWWEVLFVALDAIIVDFKPYRGA